MRPRRAYCANTEGREVETRTETPVIIRYEDDVILDSGASHHMTPFRHTLSFIDPTLAQVILPDKSTIGSNESGLLRLPFYCQQHKNRYVLPLLDILHVCGLGLNLWSVTAFNDCGHAVLFDYNTVRISICSTTGGSLHVASLYGHQIP
jgi:hypothetical protein